IGKSLSGIGLPHRVRYRTSDMLAHNISVFRSSQGVGRSVFPGRGERIRVARVKAGLTQGELAARIGTDQSTVSEWENNDRPRIRRANLLALGRELDCTPEWLERGERACQVRE